MRRLTSTLICAFGLLAPCAGALALPPPPYAVEADEGAQQGFDRYGGGSRASTPDAAPALRGRTLSWSAKTEIVAPSQAPAVYAEVAPPATAEPRLPSPPTQRVPAAGGQGPRFYSVHRDYGIEPDPIPLAPQFFGPTADLTEAAPAPLRRTPLRPSTADQGSGQ
jgi:hypothetical protein